MTIHDPMIFRMEAARSTLRSVPFRLVLPWFLPRKPRLMFWEGVEENDVEIHPAFTHFLTRSQNHSRILHFIHALPSFFCLKQSRQEFIMWYDLYSEEILSRRKTRALADMTTLLWFKMIEALKMDAK